MTLYSANDIVLSAYDIVQCKISLLYYQHMTLYSAMYTITVHSIIQNISLATLSTFSAFAANEAFAAHAT